VPPVSARPVAPRQLRGLLTNVPGRPVLNLKAEWRKLSEAALARNAAWLFAGQGASMLCQVVYYMLIARLLGKTQYGIYVGAVAMVSLLSQFSSLGSHSVLLRYTSSDRNNFSPYWGNVVAITFTLGTAFTLLFTWIGPHLAHSYSWKLFFLVAFADCLCLQTTLAASRVFQAFERMSITAGLNLMTSFLRVLLAGGMVLMIHHGTALQWSLAALLISVVPAALALYLVHSWYGSPKFSTDLMRARLSEGVVFALSYSTTGFYNDIDKAMLAHFGLNDANGIYTMAYRIIDSATMPITSVQLASIPQMFRRGLLGVRATAQYAITILKRTAPLAFLCGVIILVSAPMVRILLGQGFSETVSALRLLCLLPFFRSFQLGAGDALTGAGFQNLRLRNQAIAAGFNFAINLYLIPHYSWRGAGWASLVTDALLALWNCTTLHWLVKRSPTNIEPSAQLLSEVKPS
jgi:O-antigen/teichoic acid export membrane protein